MWKKDAVRTYNILTAVNFRDVLDNQLGILHVSGYLERDITSYGARAIQSHYDDLTLYEGLGYERGARRVLKLGASQSEYTGKEPAEYFAGARVHNARRRSLFPSASDPTDIVLTTLQRIWPQGADIARTGEGIEYCLGLARISRGSFLHFDSAVAFDAPKDSGWDPIDQTTAQVAVNLILDMPPVGSGGELMVWDRQYDTTADRWRKPHAHHDFLPQVTNGCRVAVAAPEVGDLLIFNSRNFHQVVPVTRCEGDAERIALTFFVGEVSEPPMQRLVAWS